MTTERERKSPLEQAKSLSYLIDKKKRINPCPTVKDRCLATPWDARVRRNEYKKMKIERKKQTRKENVQDLETMARIITSQFLMKNSGADFFCVSRTLKEKLLSLYCYQMVHLTEVKMRIGSASASVEVELRKRRIF